MGNEARSLAVPQVSQAGRHEPHAFQESASEEVQQTALEQGGPTLAEWYSGLGATRTPDEHFHRYGRWDRESKRDTTNGGGTAIPERVLAMHWTPWKTSEMVRGRPPPERTDQEPVALGPVPTSISLEVAERAAAATASSENEILGPKVTKSLPRQGHQVPRVPQDHHIHFLF